MRGLTVAILGNHDVSYSTESELDWTFEKLGHTILKFQENRDSTEHISGVCTDKKADLFVYVHTHGWETPGCIPFMDMIDRIIENGAITCGFHLDRYWGLNVNDKREDRIGNHPFWRMNYVFTADGGHQKEFGQRGVNHYWLPPAVVERGCYKGVYDPGLAIDVAFVGSKHYHPEYPFRTELIDWLEKTYGDRFRRYAGDTPWGTIREQRLNDLYASVKVCVGDSCFAGSPYYWSDRICETLGRGGFLLHPKSEGLKIPGLVTYAPYGFNDLKSKIDYYIEHEDERRTIADEGHRWVKKNETYTNRVSEMLDVMGFNEN